MRDELESKVGKRFTIYEAVSFKTQVVAGLNFFIKVRLLSVQTMIFSVSHKYLYPPARFDKHGVKLHKD